MKWIVITQPHPVQDEAEKIAMLFRHGADFVHLRKPESTAEEYCRLLASIPDVYLQRIVLHDHFEFSKTFPVYGLHLNRRNPEPLERWNGALSCSCHSIEEAATRKEGMDYVFLSPVFDSISKQGYKSAFTPKQLADAAASGLIDKKVVALGGITADNLPELKQWNFGGAAFLGDVWSRMGQAGAEQYLDKIRRICG